MSNNVKNPTIFAALMQIVQIKHFALIILAIQKIALATSK